MPPNSLNDIISRGSYLKMPNQCAAAQCANIGNFRFPKDPATIELWRQAINKTVNGQPWVPKACSRLCHAHCDHAHRLGVA